MTEPCENGGKDRARAGEDFVAYLAALKRSPSTLAAYRRELGRFLDWLDAQGIPDVRAVRREHVAAYASALTDSRQFKPETLHVMLRAVRRFYEHLERTGRVLVNPTDGMPFPKLGDRLPRNVLTTQEVRRLLDAPDTSLMRGIRDKAILEVLYSAGIRVGELCALSIYDADTAAGFLRIAQGIKGCKDRTVPIGVTACRYVREYLKHVRGRHTRNRRDERALFVSIRTGRALTVSAVQQMVRGYAAAAKIARRVTPHTLRHTCATHMVANGADIVHVQRLLGHAEATTTQIYTRLAPTDVQREHRHTHPAELVQPPKDFAPVRKFKGDYTRKVNREP